MTVEWAGEEILARYARACRAARPAASYWIKNLLLWIVVGGAVWAFLIWGAEDGYRYVGKDTKRDANVVRSTQPAHHAASVPRNDLQR